MVRIKNLGHPAVEIKPPLDGERHRFEIPRDETLFFWTALTIGTADRLPRIRSPRGSRLFTAGVNARKRMSLTVAIDGERVPLIADSYYRTGDYKGLAWWLAIEPMELPASVCVRFETTGNQPMDRSDPIVLWTQQGERIRWGTTKESTIELVPSDRPTSDFQTRREDLWESHTVYQPVTKPASRVAVYRQRYR